MDPAVCDIRVQRRKLDTAEREKHRTDLLLGHVCWEILTAMLSPRNVYYAAASELQSVLSVI